MNKLKKYALIGVPVLIGAYLIYRQFKKTSGEIGKYVPPPTPKPTVTPKTTTTSTNTGECNYPIKKGVYNCDLVRQLQWALNHIPSTQYEKTDNLVKYRPLKEDGDFGPKTEAVLLDFWLQNSVEDSNDMDVVLSYVVEDPVAFQEAENHYILNPTCPSGQTLINGECKPNSYTPTDWEHNPLNPNHI